MMITIIINKNLSKAWLRSNDSIDQCLQTSIPQSTGRIGFYDDFNHHV
ncbi:unnamed protein product, partial [Prunus brigantina]